MIDDWEDLTPAFTPIWPETYKVLPCLVACIGNRVQSALRHIHK